MNIEGAFLQADFSECDQPSLHFLRREHTTAIVVVNQKTRKIFGLKTLSLALTMQ